MFRKIPSLAAVAACTLVVGCASGGPAKTYNQPVAAAACPAGTVRACDHRSARGCQCITRHDVDTVKGLFH